MAQVDYSSSTPTFSERTGSYVSFDAAPGDSGDSFDDLSKKQQNMMKRAAKLDDKGKATKAEDLRNKATYGTKDPAEIARMKLLKEARKFDKNPEAFGVSKQEREATMAAARQAGEQSAQGIQTVLARKEMSGAGIQSPGELQKAARDAGSGQMAVQADASARLAKLHTDRINAKNAEIRLALANERPPPPTTAEQMANTFATDVAPVILGDIAYGAVV